MNLYRMKYEIKAMRSTFYIPLIILSIVFLYCYAAHVQDLEYYKAFYTMQVSITVFSGWWINFYMANLLENEGGELFFTYPISIFRLTLFNYFKYTLGFILLTTLEVIAVNSLYGSFDFSSLWLIIAQCFFYSALSYFGIIISKESGWNLFLVFGYLFFQLLTEGKIIPLFNVYFFGGSINLIYLNIFKCTVIGIGLLLIGQTILSEHKGKGVKRRKRTKVKIS